MYMYTVAHSQAMTYRVQESALAIVAAGGNAAAAAAAASGASAGALALRGETVDHATRAANARALAIRAPSKPKPDVSLGSSDSSQLIPTHLLPARAPPDPPSSGTRNGSSCASSPDTTAGSVLWPSIRPTTFSPPVRLQRPLPLPLCALLTSSAVRVFPLQYSQGRKTGQSRSGISPPAA